MNYIKKGRGKGLILDNGALKSSCPEANFDFLNGFEYYFILSFFFICIGYTPEQRLAIKNRKDKLRYHSKKKDHPIPAYLLTPLDFEISDSCSTADSDKENIHDLDDAQNQLLLLSKQCFKKDLLVLGDLLEYFAEINRICLVPNAIRLNLQALKISLRELQQTIENGIIL